MSLPDWPVCMPKVVERRDFCCLQPRGEYNLKFCSYRNLFIGSEP